MRLVLAKSVGRQRHAASGLELDQLLEQVAHRLGGATLEPGEGGAAEAELHAALGVDGPHLHPPLPDGRRQAVDQGPQHGALAGPGRAGDQDVGALEAETPGREVVS